MKRMRARRRQESVHLIGETMERLDKWDAEARTRIEVVESRVVPVTQRGGLNVCFGLESQRRLAEMQTAVESVNW